jgi:hypothetical protein
VVVAIALDNLKSGDVEYESSRTLLRHAMLLHEISTSTSTSNYYTL